MKRRYLGLDLTDPYARRRRPICAVELVPDGPHASVVLHPPIDWPTDWPSRAVDLLPSTAGPTLLPFVHPEDDWWLGIDGPLGLAGTPGARLREAERLVRAPGRTPFDYPPAGFPFGGFVTGSIVLWSWLTQFRGISVDGSSRPGRIRACEVFPGATWRTLATRRLSAKQSPQGRQERLAILQTLGIAVPVDWPTASDLTDRLDAALAAWGAWCWGRGEAEANGTAPWWDDQSRTWREGWIRTPFQVVGS